jgi:hypothetical protein
MKSVTTLDTLVDKDPLGHNSRIIKKKDFLQRKGKKVGMRSNECEVGATATLKYLSWACRRPSASTGIEPSYAKVPCILSYQGQNSVRISPGNKFESRWSDRMSGPLDIKDQGGSWPQKLSFLAVAS